MSTFQISLAIAGGAVLAGVVVYNTLTSRRLLPKKPENPAEEPGSPGLDSADDRRERPHTPPDYRCTLRLQADLEAGAVNQVHDR